MQGLNLMLVERPVSNTRFRLIAGLICLAVFLPHAMGLAASTSYDARTISMFTMNTATAVSRIRNGEFSVVYRGFGSRKPGEIDNDELLGFRFLLDMTHQSRGLRNVIEEKLQKGLPQEEAFFAAREEHTKILQKIFKTFESSKDLYENRPGKFAASKAGLPDPETHFLFTSPRIGVARMYGPIILVIQETRPRGMDLNGIARDARYYSLARFLKNIGNRDFRMILSDYVADRDEYVIPSYITPADISGLIVHAPAPIVIGGRLAVPPPPVRRVYRKYRRQGAMTIDVVDGKDRLIARLSASPSAAVIGPDEVRSSAQLPGAIEEAWNNYLKTIRRGGKR